MDEKEIIETKLIEIAIKIVRDKSEGCIFVLCDTLPEQSTFLLEQDIKPFSIFENARRTELLGSHDGACLINSKGELHAYAINLNADKSFPNYGLRHSAAFSESRRGNTCILGSQEDKKVRLFKEGEIVIQIDVYEKGIERNINRAITAIETNPNIFNSIGIGTLSSLGTAIGVSFLGVTGGVLFFPGIVIFSASHYILKKIATAEVNK